MSDERREWCLICSQRPAEGTMRRVFVGSMVAVVLDSKIPQPHVCQPCADLHHGTPAKPGPSGKPTVWEFILEDPAPPEPSYAPDEEEHEEESA